MQQTLWFMPLTPPRLPFRTVPPYLMRPGGDAPHTWTWGVKGAWFSSREGKPIHPILWEPCHMSPAHWGTVETRYCEQIKLPLPGVFTAQGALQEAAEC